MRNFFEFHHAKAQRRKDAKKRKGGDLRYFLLFAFLASWRLGVKKWERIFFLTCVILLVGIVPVGAQQGNDPVSFIGMRLHELISRFGVPQSVFASRGGNHWQDDVVFVYNEGDFYIYRDRVWQVGVKSLLNMKIGDAKAVALLVLGEDARDMGDYLLYPISDNAWPISLRVNFNAGKITAIFIYRTDY